MLTQVLEGEDAALLVAQLFDHYSQPIFAYLFRLTGSRESADELTQETYLRAFNARHRLAGVTNQRAWLYRIATNLAFDAVRRRRRFTWLPWNRTDDLHAPAPDVAERANQAEAIETALATLPVHYRAPLLLYSYHDLSIVEVAAALNLSEGAVKMRLRRAREQFRKAYDWTNAANGGLS